MIESDAHNDDCEPAFSLFIFLLRMIATSHFGYD